jgi:hypothetical protein
VPFIDRQTLQAATSGIGGALDGERVIVTPDEHTTVEQIAVAAEMILDEYGQAGAVRVIAHRGYVLFEPTGPTLLTLVAAE